MSDCYNIYPKFLSAFNKVRFVALHNDECLNYRMIRRQLKEGYPLAVDASSDNETRMCLQNDNRGQRARGVPRRTLGQR